MATVAINNPYAVQVQRYLAKFDLDWTKIAMNTTPKGYRDIEGTFHEWPEGFRYEVLEAWQMLRVAWDRQEEATDES